jgi:hypothetical protein
VKVDCMGIIEAGYAPAATEKDWIATVLEPFDPLTRGMGSTAGIVDFGEARPKVGDWVARGPVPTQLSTGWQKMYAFLAQEHPGPCERCCARSHRWSAGRRSERP